MAILLVWAGTLGWHVKRLYFRPVSELLAEAARTIPPGTAYYSVSREGHRIGWAQTDIDTLPGATGFLVSDRLVLGEGLLPGQDPLDVRVEATLGSTFALRAFDLSAVGIPGIRHVRGEVHGDTLIELEVRGDAPSRRQAIPLEGPVFVAAAWPLRFAAEREVEPGERYELGVFDPLAGGRRRMSIEVVDRATRTFPDSVTAEQGRWVTAREDTVRAWRVEHDLSGITLTAWVDEDGRLLEADAPGGLHLERTAFELAYFGERVPTRLPGPPGATPAPDTGPGATEPDREPPDLESQETGSTARPGPPPSIREERER